MKQELIRKICLIEKDKLTKEELYESEYWSKNKFIQTTKEKSGKIYTAQQFMHEVITNGFDPKNYAIKTIDEGEDVNLEYVDWEPDEISKIQALGFEDVEDFSGIMRPKCPSYNLLLTKFKCGIFVVSEYDKQNDLLNAYAYQNIPDLIEGLKVYMED